MLTYMSGIDVKTAFNILQEVLSVTSLTEESEEQVKSLKVELESLEQQLEATRTVLMGLFGLNRKRVEAMVVEQLEKESFVIRPDTGKLTIREFVKRMPDQYLFEVFEKMQKKAQKKKAKESSIFYTRQVSFIKRNNG